MYDVTGWELAVHMSQNFRLFHVSNSPVLDFRIFLLMHTESQSYGARSEAAAPVGCVGSRDVEPSSQAVEQSSSQAVEQSPRPPAAYLGTTQSQPAASANNTTTGG